VTIDELRWFLVLASTENVSRAAEQLHIGQPTLSRALRRLERQVGAPLFDRTRQRLRLNNYGEAFRARAQRAVDELARAEDDIAVMLGPGPGTLRLAFLHSLGTWLLPDLLGRFGQTDTQTKFVLHQDSADQVLAALLSGRADLVLTSPQPRDPLVSWAPLLDQKLSLAVWKDHPLAGRESLRLSEVLHERYVAMQPEFGLRQTTDAMFARRGIKPNIILESAEIATIGGLVANELGVAILPDRPMPAQSPNMRLIPLEDGDAFRTIGIAWPSVRPLPQAARRFRIFVLGQPSADAMEHGQPPQARLPVRA